MRLLLVLILTSMIGCGVKGPPEPPLPNEANLEKQISKDATKDAAATPAAQMTPPDTATTKEKVKDPTTKKKTKE